MTEEKLSGWLLRNIVFEAPDMADGQMDVFRDQSVTVVEEQEGLVILEATDSLFYEDDGGRNAIASVTFRSFPVSDVDSESEDALKKEASIVWRVASFIYSFMTNMALGTPVVLSPTILSEERRSKPVFSFDVDR